LRFSFSASDANVKSVRVNITLPADVLSVIDRCAERKGFTRSGFFARAARKAMAVSKLATASSAAGWRRQGPPHPRSDTVKRPPVYPQAHRCLAKVHPRVSPNMT
jgi:hypothetical protein